MLRKSQSSIEFLTTYAWAFVIIGITLAALYYFGFLSFKEYLPQKCTFSSQFKCLDFSLKPTEVRIKLVNNIGEDIDVTSIMITSDPASSFSCTSPLIFTWPRETDADIIFTACSGGGYIAGARAELTISMTYYAISTPSKPIHTINGKVNGKVLPS